MEEYRSVGRVIQVCWSEKVTLRKLTVKVTDELFISSSPRPSLQAPSLGCWDRLLWNIQVLLLCLTDESVHNH